MNVTMPAAALKVFSDGLAPLLSDAQLERLRQALASDNPTLIQGATVESSPVMVNRLEPARGVCLLTYTGWPDDGQFTVEQAEDYFGELVFRIDQAIGGPGECRWLLQWWDDTPRTDVRRLLLIEVEAVLAHRRCGRTLGRAG